MALISCPECGAEISDSARQCPRCGRPMAEPSSEAVTTRAGGKWEALGFSLIAVGIVLGIAGLGAFAGALAILGFALFLVGRFN